MKKTKKRCWECRRAAVTPTGESVLYDLCLRHHVMLSWPYFTLAVQRREVGYCWAFLRDCLARLGRWH